MWGKSVNISRHHSTKNSKETKKITTRPRSWIVTSTKETSLFIPTDSVENVVSKI